MAIEEKKFLGTAGVQQLITNTRTEIAAAEKAAKDYADSLADNYDAAGTAATKVQELANGQVKTNKEAIGTLGNLETTAKTDLVVAINEVRNAVSAGGTAAALTMEEKSTGLGDGILKAYVLKQGDNTVGTINIPKDMVVQSGEVVTNPEGQAAGTYIKLTLANATNDVIYVNVGTLVDIYKAKASATQIQLAIDSSTREISATIVAGSVTATELAANAVVTAKIADGNVTKVKLATDVQTSLGKADTALQPSDISDWAKAASKPTYTHTEVGAAPATHGHAHTEITGLGSLATKSTVTKTDLATDVQASLDKADAASADATKKAQQALDDAKDYADDQDTALGQSLTQQFESAIQDLEQGKIANLEKSLAEGGATATAIASANSMATNAMNKATNLENGAIATNTSNIAGLRTDVDALKSVSYVEITTAEIDGMFA